MRKRNWTLLPTGPMAGSGGARLELGALGAACCAALVILAVFAHFLLCTLVQTTSVVTWVLLGWMFSPVPAVGGGSAGVGRCRQAGGSWCDHTSAPRSSTCPRGAVGMEHSSCCCPGKQLYFIFPRQNSALSFCSGRFTLKLLLFQRSCNFYELLWVMQNIITAQLFSLLSYVGKHSSAGLVMHPCYFVGCFFPQSHEIRVKRLIW